MERERRTEEEEAGSAQRLLTNLADTPEYQVLCCPCILGFIDVRLVVLQSPHSSHTLLTVPCVAVPDLSGAVYLPSLPQLRPHLLLAVSRPVEEQ